MPDLENFSRTGADTNALTKEVAHLLLGCEEDRSLSGVPGIRSWRIVGDNRRKGFATETAQ
jgi:hypothetical protein